MRFGLVASLSGVALIAQATLAAAQMSDAELIENAVSAAPPAVAENATIVAVDEEGNMRTLREGTNNFTCMADDPTPGNNPMCLDANGMEWAHAWMTKAEPPEGKVGFGYMLAGGATPSNIDPHAAEPAGGELKQEPAHVMIFNLPQPVEDYPDGGENPDMTQPWVMWKGTPYEHLMVPVE